MDFTIKFFDANGAPMSAAQVATLATGTTYFREINGTRQKLTR